MEEKRYPMTNEEIEKALLDLFVQYLIEQPADATRLTLSEVQRAADMSVTLLPTITKGLTVTEVEAMKNKMVNLWINTVKKLDGDD